MISDTISIFKAQTPRPECWKPEVRSIDAPTCRRMRSEFLEQMHNKLRAKFGRSCNWNDVWLYILLYFPNLSQIMVYW